MNTKYLAALCLLSFTGKLNAEGSLNDQTCPEIWNGTEVFLPSSSSCSEYFHCVHGNPVLMSCPEGLYWDQSRNICNYPDEVSPPCTGCVIETGVYISAGNNVGQLHVENGTEECASQCALTEGCVAWTLNVHQSYCWLKSDDSNKGEAEGWTTGIKACGSNENACFAHSDCPTVLPFCYNGNCAVCQECQYCHDGIDGTCGTCGAGFPTNEEGSCKDDEDYEQWDCETCQAHDGFTYCQWPEQFNADGGCLPNVNDGRHIPCGEEDGDVIVELCPAPVMSKDDIKMEDDMVSEIDAKAPCWGGTYEKCAQNCESVVPDIALEICKFACRQACTKN